MKAAEMSIAEFRTKVHAYLHAAMLAVPSRVPADVVTDPCAHQMMKPLEALHDLLYGLGSEERDKDCAERNRELKVEAKRRVLGLEELVMQIDRRVQHAMVVLGSSAVNVLAPMDADLCISAFVQLLDVFPDSAFSTNRPHDFPSTRDLTVATIVSAMRIRKEQQR